MDVFKGDIVTITEPVFVDYPGGVWADHFVDKKRHYVVIDSMQNNNGDFRAKDSKGRMQWLRVDKVESVKRHS